MVRFLLEVLVENFPLLLQGSDELLALIFGHQHLLLVACVLLLNLHLLDKVVLVLDFVLDLGDVLGDLSEIFLLQHVLVLLGWKLGCSKDVLDSVGNNEVLV